jgi:hypothetical protein
MNLEQFVPTTLRRARGMALERPLLDGRARDDRRSVLTVDEHLGDVAGFPRARGLLRAGRAQRHECHRQRDHQFSRPGSLQGRHANWYGVSPVDKLPCVPGSLQLLADDDQPNAECVARGSCARS